MLTDLISNKLDRIEQNAKAVLRSCCVELFVVSRNALELLSPACSVAQHHFFNQNKMLHVPSC